MVAEDLLVVDQRALQQRRDLEALGHDVERDEAIRAGQLQGAGQLRQVRRVDDPRLVRQDVQPRLERGDDGVDLAAVPPRDDDDVARLASEHARQRVVRGVDLHLPVRRAGASRALNPAIRPRWASRSGPSGAKTWTVGETPGIISFWTSAAWKWPGFHVIRRISGMRCILPPLRRPRRPSRLQRAGLGDALNSNSHASNFFTTSPCTSVRRKSRPW